MKVKLLFILLIFTAFTSLTPVTESYPQTDEEEYETTETKRQFNIIDVHEHIRSYPVVEKYWPARKKHNIKGMVLVGSPKETLGLMINSKHKWFTKPDINNKVVLKLARDYPGEFYPFVTFSPDDEDQVEKLKSFVKEGAMGVKLYNGHSNFYEKMEIPLTAPHLMKLYAHCEKNEIPMIFHVNLNKYWDEFIEVLDAHPKLKVNIPHYGLLLRKLSKVEHILKTYPNTYFDVSFGHFYFAYIGMKRISRMSKRMRRFVKKYQNRFLFGVDIVLTNNPEKSKEYVTEMIQAYRNVLEKKRYTSTIIDQYFSFIRKKKTRKNGWLKGLNLDDETLRMIYEENPKRFIGLKEE